LNWLHQFVGLPKFVRITPTMLEKDGLQSSPSKSLMGRVKGGSGRTFFTYLNDEDAAVCEYCVEYWNRAEEGYRWKMGLTYATDKVIPLWKTRLYFGFSSKDPEQRKHNR
jgi:hypothetical protein